MTPNRLTNDLYAAQLHRDLDTLTHARHDFVWMILGLHGALVGLFAYWALG